MNPVSPSEQVLLGAVEGLRGDTRSGFESLNSRIDSMVTKDTFNAEVRRLNQRDDHIEDKLAEGLEIVSSRVELGFAEIEARDARRDEEARRRDAARDSRFARRMTWTLSIVGLVWGVMTFFIGPLVG